VVLGAGEDLLAGIEGDVVVSHGFLPSPEVRSLSFTAVGAPVEVGMIRAWSLGSTWGP